MNTKLLAVLLFNILAHHAISQSWSALGSGMGSSYYSSVQSFAVYNNELYTGGSFSTAGGVAASNVAKWNGTQWGSVGSGVNGQVSALCVYNGDLYAGGYFGTAGGMSANGIARWNGTSWNSAGSLNTNAVRALAVYNGELYASGYFTGLTSPEGTCMAKWNGSAWSAVGGGVDSIINQVECMAVYNGELYAGGALIGGGGTAGSYGIVKWNGTAWNTVITWPAMISPDGPLGDVFSMAVYNGELYAAGTIGMMSGFSVSSQIARWNGTSWLPVGTGVTGAVYSSGDGTGDGSAYSSVRSLAVYNGALYAGGRFQSCGNIATQNIARWDGASWSALGAGANGSVYSLIASDSSLYAGGVFNQVNGNLPASKVARWGNPCSTPQQPNGITGNHVVCAGSMQVYSVPPVSGAATYTWILPPGWSGSSSTNQITTMAGAMSGTINVAANNSCGSSPELSFPVSVASAPPQPGPVMGSVSVCAGSICSYSIDTVPGASYYNWSVPSGWSGTSTNTTLVVTAGNAPGAITVTAHNGCGGSNERMLPVTISPVVSQPGPIAGENLVNIGQVAAYSISPVSGASGYDWSVSGGGNIISGQNSTAVMLNWSVYGNHVISVQAIDSCGAGMAQTKTVAVSAPTGLNEPGNPFGIIVYPNPSSGKFYIRNTSAGSRVIRIEVMNIGGQPVQPVISKRILSGYEELVNLQHVPQGSYLVRITVNQDTFVFKVAKLQ